MDCREQRRRRNISLLLYVSMQMEMLMGGDVVIIDQSVAGQDEYARWLK